MPSFDITSEKKNVVDFLVDGEVEKSKRQAREDVTNGAIAISGEEVTDVNFEIDPTNIMMVICIGSSW